MSLNKTLPHTSQPCSCHNERQRYASMLIVANVWMVTMGVQVVQHRQSCRLAGLPGQGIQGLHGAGPLQPAVTTLLPAHLVVGKVAGGVLTQQLHLPLAGCAQP
jgi:hypothetical protein